MRIDQILPSFAVHDGVGSDVLHLQTLLRARGYKSDIFARASRNPELSRPFDEYLTLPESKRICIYHYSVGSDIPYYLGDLPGYKVVRYHNITPEHFFQMPGFEEAYWKCWEGRNQLSLIKKSADFFCSVSQFNARDFGDTGSKPNWILPIVRDYQRVAKQEGASKLNTLLKTSLKKKILFVGRGIPNKAPHDLLLYLKLCQTVVRPDVQLLYVGGYHDGYCRGRLSKLSEQLGLTSAYLPRGASDFAADVVFSGPVDEEELVSYYKHSDVFLSLSDHEGFCIPLIEAMNFGLPVLAHKAAAIAETLGEAGGILFDKNEPVAALASLGRVLTDDEFYKQVAAMGRKRAQEFTWQKIVAKFDSFLNAMMEEYGAWSAHH